MDEEKTRRTAEAPGCFFCVNVKPMLHNIWSDATRGHFRNSRVEFLKGIRSILDDRIANLSRPESRDARRGGLKNHGCSAARHNVNVVPTSGRQSRWWPQRSRCGWLRSSHNQRARY